MMPHAIRRVYVARRARTAASLAITLVGAAMLVIAAKPTWTAFLAKGLPGINPAVLCTLTVAMWLVGLFTYFAARAVDEHRFAVAMSKLVMPGKDVNEDVERLSHENPDQAARDMAHRLEVRSSTLPILAAAVLLPVTALYAVASWRAHGWPVIADFEAAVATNAMKLIACAGGGMVLALAMTKRATRLPIVAPMAAIVAVACIGVAVGIKTMWLIPPALLLGTMALVVRRLRIERDKLQAEDPAAGSEIFTIRGFIRQMRASGAAVIARVNKISRRRKIIIGATLAASVLGGSLMIQSKKHKRQQAAQAAVSAAMVRKAIQTPTVTPTGSRSQVEPMGDGRLKVTLDLADDKPLVIPSLNGLSSVPPMWTATVRIEQEAGTDLSVSAFGPEDALPVSITNAQETTRSNCDIDQLPLGLNVKGQPGHYVLYVKPVLTPAGC